MHPRWMIALGVASIAATAYATALLMAPPADAGVSAAGPHTERSPDVGPAARRHDPATRIASAGAQAPAAGMQPRISPHAHARARVQEEFEATAREAVEQGRVSEYLDDLAARAEARGTVSALEVEPGLLALQASEASPEELAAFGQRMAALSARLRGDDGPAPAPPMPFAHEVEE